MITKKLRGIYKNNSFYIFQFEFSISNCAKSVQSFCRLLDTSKQRDKPTNKQIINLNKQIENQNRT